MPNYPADLDNLETLDSLALNRLKRDMGDDIGIVLDAYVESIDELLGEIANRSMRTPRADLHRWAHSLKSSAASIGAMRLAHMAAQMEHCYRDRQSIDVDVHLQDMQNEYRRVSVRLEGFDSD